MKREGEEEGGKEGEWWAESCTRGWVESVRVL
jgi:hypothetical protein